MVCTKSAWVCPPMFSLVTQASMSQSIASSLAYCSRTRISLTPIYKIAQKPAPKELVEFLAIPFMHKAGRAKTDEDIRMGDMTHKHLVMQNLSTALSSQVTSSGDAVCKLERDITGKRQRAGPAYGERASGGCSTISARDHR
jgi:hypothetical protein